MQVGELQDELLAAEQRSKEHVAALTSAQQHELESLRAAATALTSALGKQVQEITAERDQLSEQVRHCRHCLCARSRAPAQPLCNDCVAGR